MRKLGAVWVVVGVALGAGAAVSPTLGVTAELSPSPATPLVSLSDALKTIGPRGKIVFYRADTDWPPRAFLVDPDGSHEVAIAERGTPLPGVWSPDGSQLLVPRLVPDEPEPDGQWFRPALINADGSALKVLDGYPERQMNLLPLAWSPDGTRLFVYDGFDAADTADMGTLTMRSSDGGDLTMVLAAPSETLERPDFVHVAPDGTRLLVNRQAKGQDPELFVVAVGDDQLVQINPPGTTSVETPVGDFLERGALSEAWSPDGTRVTFGAFVEAADSTALFVANADGTDLRQVVAPDVGAVSAQWSPDGSWIAFTSKWRSQPQLWVVHPDGTGLARLTDGGDGSTSVAPVWSPDGAHLLFEHMAGGVVNLWSMNADGSSPLQLTSAPLGTDFVGPYQWLPAHDQGSASG